LLITLSENFWFLGLNHSITLANQIDLLSFVFYFRK